MDLREVVEFLKDVSAYIILFLIVLFVFTFVVALHPIAGNSMVPTLEEGQVVAVSKFSYKIGTIERNEIVALNKDGKNFVKRIVGLPGEEIHYLFDNLYIDGVAYKETFLKEGIETSNFMFEDICSKEDCPNGVIPDDMYLVLGDNRPESQDSRDKSFGLVRKDEIQGKVVFKIWPINSIGEVR